MWDCCLGVSFIYFYICVTYQHINTFLNLEDELHITYTPSSTTPSSHLFYNRLTILIGQLSMTTGSQRKGMSQPRGEQSLNVPEDSSADSSIEEPRKEDKSVLQAQPCQRNYEGKCIAKEKLLRLQPSLPTHQQQHRNEDVANVPLADAELPHDFMPSQLWRPCVE